MANGDVRDKLFALGKEEILKYNLDESEIKFINKKEREVYIFSNSNNYIEFELLKK